jgi:hypothetical protein
VRDDPYLPLLETLLLIPAYFGEGAFIVAIDADQLLRIAAGQLHVLYRIDVTAHLLAVSCGIICFAPTPYGYVDPAAGLCSDA